MKYIILVVIALISVLIMMPSPSAGAPCGPIFTRPIYNGPIFTKPYIKETIVKETIVAPVAIPVIVPATVFQYLPAISPVVTTPTLVPSAPMAAPTAPMGGGDGSNITAIDNLIRTRLEAILREHQAGTASIGASIGTGDDPPPLTFEVNTPATNAPVRRDANWTNNMKLACARCHQQGNITRGNIYLFNNVGAYAPNVDERIIRGAIASNAMPKNSKLDASVKQLLLDGLPE